MLPWFGGLTWCLPQKDDLKFYPLDLLKNPNKNNNIISKAKLNNNNKNPPPPKKKKKKWSEKFHLPSAFPKTVGFFKSHFNCPGSKSRGGVHLF